MSAPYGPFEDTPAPAPVAADRGGQAAPAPDASQSSHLMTAERREQKYELARDRLQPFVAELSKRLPHHRFTGTGANTLPRPRHFVTTIYFDTPSRETFHATRAHHDDHIKMRAREYYDIHPSLAELATDPRQIVKYQPLLWLELKFKQGTRTGKRRIGIPKSQVPGFFRHGLVTPELIDLQRQLYGQESEAVLAEMADFSRRFTAPLSADCVVNYRRLPWQDAAGMLRVTLDLGVEFYPPPEDLWRRDYALVRETLGRPKGHLDSGILEVKCRGELPSWLLELMTSLGASRVRTSKFEIASQAVHGPQ